MGSHLSAGPAELVGLTATWASAPSSSIKCRALQPASVWPQGLPKFQLRQQRCRDGVRQQQEGGAPQLCRAHCSSRENGRGCVWVCVPHMLEIQADLGDMDSFDRVGGRRGGRYMLFNFILLLPAPSWKVPFLFRRTHPPPVQKLHCLQHSTQRRRCWEGQEYDSELNQLLVVSSLNPEGLIFSLPSFRLNFVLAGNCLVCAGRDARR